MDKIVHKSNTRGLVEHGWLTARHTFSFANYYNPDRVHFGALRVLNDDIVQADMGFGTHPHENMEIITIPLVGKLEHKDSMGNGSVIGAGEIQVMSAGKGITHSEFNPSKTELVNLLQIWIFTKTKYIDPRYDQKKFDQSELKNNFKLVVSPNGYDNSLIINQDAWLSIGEFDPGIEIKYQIKSKKNGIYLFVINGDVDLLGEELNERDGIGIKNTSEIELKIKKDAKILIIDIPL